MIDKVLKRFISNLKGAKIETKYLTCDNARENVKGVRDVCNANGIELELTLPHTPQYNGVVERGFVIICNRAMAMMLST